MSEYVASPTGAKFHAADDLVRLLIGPIGSGKSVTCCIEAVVRAHAQRPNARGVRKSRWAIIRNTYRELIDTTMRTWFDWFPQELGSMSKQDMTWTLTGDLEDGTSIHAEFLFRALDKPNDVKKLLSLELTGGFINEAREIPKEILDMLIGRVGRYPSAREGGASWYGIIMDTNPPDNDHWMYTLFEEDRPDGFKVFHQPSGLSKEAENIDNLPKGYYDNLLHGKDVEWIKVYVHGEYGFVSDGRPVYPEFQDSIHALQETPVYSEKDKIYVGIDFGLTPAATFGMLTSTGQLLVLDELVTFNMGAKRFSSLLRQKIHEKFKNNPIELYGDPAGEQRAQTDEMTPFMIMDKEGFTVWPAETNDFSLRREVIADLLGKLDFAGNPAFAVAPEAATLRKGFNGGYRYRRMQVSGEEKYQDKVDKNRFSHVSDACQYMALGAVGLHNVIGGYSKDFNYAESDRAIL